MDLKNLKELLKVLREKGVLEFEMDGVKLKLSEEAPQSKYKKRQEVEVIDDQDELTEEELLFYSATPPLETEQQQ